MLGQGQGRLTRRVGSCQECTAERVSLGGWEGEGKADGWGFVMAEKKERRQ